LEGLNPFFDGGTDKKDETDEGQESKNEGGGQGRGIHDKLIASKINAIVYYNNSDKLSRI
jgi:hypothetical protein